MHFQIFSVLQVASERLKIWVGICGQPYGSMGNKSVKADIFLRLNTTRLEFIKIWAFSYQIF